MPAPPRRPILALAFLAWAGGRSLGQQGHGLPQGPSLGVGHLGGFYQPFWGFGRPVGFWAAPHPAPVTFVPHPHPTGIFGPMGPAIGVAPSLGSVPFFAGPAFVAPGMSPMTPAQAGPGGLWLAQPAGTSAAHTPAPRPRSNPARAAELVELGDRAFRGGNYRKADERYQLAIKSDGESPAPHVRLAQVALIRSNYARAAGHLREAVEAGGGRGWLLDAPDVQSLYGEPRDFARRIALIESHLQARPEDRDAWFVLGAERYLSGHPREAVDAFVRLDDRTGDPALTAFQDAATVSMRSLARGDAADRANP